MDHNLLEHLFTSLTLVQQRSGSVNRAWLTSSLWWRLWCSQWPPPPACCPCNWAPACPASWCSGGLTVPSTDAIKSSQDCPLLNTSSHQKSLIKKTICLYDISLTWAVSNLPRCPLRDQELYRKQVEEVIICWSHLWQDLWFTNSLPMITNCFRNYVCFFCSKISDGNFIIFTFLQNTFIDFLWWICFKLINLYVLRKACP